MTIKRFAEVLEHHKCVTNNGADGGCDGFELLGRYHSKSAQKQSSHRTEEDNHYGRP
jgi:hypothetical protein